MRRSRLRPVGLVAAVACPTVAIGGQHEVPHDRTCDRGLDYVDPLCCWPGQVSNGRFCGGTPACPEGFVAHAETCVPSACEYPEKEQPGGQCCMPGQNWSAVADACEGVPTSCGDHYLVRGEVCWRDFSSLPALRTGRLGRAELEEETLSCVRPGHGRGGTLDRPYPYEAETFREFSWSGKVVGSVRNLSTDPCEIELTVTYEAEIGVAHTSPQAVDDQCGKTFPEKRVVTSSTAFVLRTHMGDDPIIVQDYDSTTRRPLTFSCRSCSGENTTTFDTPDGTRVGFEIERDCEAVAKRIRARGPFEATPEDRCVGSLDSMALAFSLDSLANRCLRARALR